MSADSQPAVRPPTDFSELHRQDMERRRKLEEEEKRWAVEPVNEMEPPVKRRQLTPEEIEQWQQLEDSAEDVDDNANRIPDEDPEFTKQICREHIKKRLEILKSGKEDELTIAEFDSLPEFDRLRLGFLIEYELEDKDVANRNVLNFIRDRIDSCPFEEFVIGYKIVLEMFDPILSWEFYYLSVWEGTSTFHQKERYCLFGF